MVKKLHKVNLQELHHNGLQDNLQAELLMEMLELEVTLIFSTLDLINANNLIMETFIGKLIY